MRMSQKTIKDGAEEGNDPGQETDGAKDEEAGRILLGPNLSCLMLVWTVC